MCSSCIHVFTRSVFISGMDRDDLFHDLWQLFLDIFVTLWTQSSDAPNSITNIDSQLKKSQGDQCDVQGFQYFLMILEHSKIKKKHNLPQKLSYSTVRATHMTTLLQLWYTVNVCLGWITWAKSATFLQLSSSRTASSLLRSQIQRREVSLRSLPYSTMAVMAKIPPAIFMKTEKPIWEETFRKLKLRNKLFNTSYLQHSLKSFMSFLTKQDERSCPAKMDTIPLTMNWWEVSRCDVRGDHKFKKSNFFLKGNRPFNKLLMYLSKSYRL